MRRLITALLFTLLSLPILSFAGSTSLVKRSFTHLPGGWMFVLAEPPKRIGPLDISAPQMAGLYTAATAHAQVVPSHRNTAVTFTLGDFVLLFREDGEGELLNWQIIVVFCEKMKREAMRGDTILYAGWLRNYEKSGQILVTLSIRERAKPVHV